MFWVGTLILLSRNLPKFLWLEWLTHLIRSRIINQPPDVIRYLPSHFTSLPLIANTFTQSIVFPSTNMRKHTYYFVTLGRGLPIFFQDKITSLTFLIWSSKPIMRTPDVTKLDYLNIGGKIHFSFILMESAFHDTIYRNHDDAFNLKIIMLSS